MLPRLLLLFILVPVAELFLFLTIGAKIGIVNTLLIIVLTAILGASLTRSQGARTLAKFKQATAEGRLPHREALDGLLILLAGAVLITPGFLTDTVGFLLLIPPVRALVRTRLSKYLQGRIQLVPGPVPGTQPDPDRSPIPKGDFIDV